MLPLIQPYSLLSSAPVACNSHSSSGTHSAHCVSLGTADYCGNVCGGHQAATPFCCNCGNAVAAHRFRVAVLCCRHRLEGSGVTAITCDPTPACMVAARTRSHLGTIQNLHQTPSASLSSGHAQRDCAQLTGQRTFSYGGRDGSASHNTFYNTPALQAPALI